jgi:hypothetical protein
MGCESGVLAAIRATSAEEECSALQQIAGETQDVQRFVRPHL